MNDYLLKSINTLFKNINNSDIDFHNEVCEFLAEGTGFEAVVLFEIHEKKMLFLGKSSRTPSDYLIGNDYYCDVCQNIDSAEDFSITSNPKCQLKIPAQANYDYCIKFSGKGGKNYLLKAVKNVPISDRDNSFLWEASDLISNLLHQNDKVKGTEIDSTFSLKNFFSEIRSPLNGILKGISDLTKALKKDGNKDTIQLVQRETQKVLSVINDLYYFDQKSANKLTAQKKDFKIAKFFQNFEDNFISRKNITLKIQNDSGIKVVNTDQERLYYVLSHLCYLLNCLNNKSVIDVNITTVQNSFLKFVVRNDNSGINFSEKDLLKPYFLNQVDSLNNCNVSGLSIPVIEAIVSMLGGNFKIQQNNGLFFEFTIDGGLMSDYSSSISKLPKPDGNLNSILVIEDDFASARMLNQYLKNWGYDPTIANTPEQAFDYIKKTQFLAIILNIELPNCNGLELLKELKEMPETKGAPVIVFSMEAESQKAFMMGAVEYFVKPVNYNYLVEVITNYKLRRDSVVLCVDDDEPSLNLISNAIEQVGLKPLPYLESHKVLDSIRGKHIDLAIIDLDMPHINGFELIKLIKSEDQFANLPIIIYTGKEDFDDDLQKIDGLFESLLDKKSTSVESLKNQIDAMINRYETPPPVEEVIKKDDNVIKILLAEDYKHSQIIVTRLLKKNGFENIVVVENGQQAVEMAQQEHFSLILMDMQMPIMNGFDATQTIRSYPGYNETPIIALTAFAMKGDREKCLDAGATDYIPKPIDSKEFIEKVKHYTSA